MKQFLINLFKIEQYFYISCIGFTGKNNLTYNNSTVYATGSLNIEIVRQNIIYKNNLTAYTSLISYLSAKNNIMS